MTAAGVDALMQHALTLHRISDAAVGASREVQDAGAPDEFATELVRIGTQLRELGLRLEEVAKNAAPMPRRD